MFSCPPDFMTSETNAMTEKNLVPLRRAWNSQVFGGSIFNPIKARSMMDVSSMMHGDKGVCVPNNLFESIVGL